jgi:hypothetical protein
MALAMNRRTYYDSRRAGVAIHSLHLVAAHGHR